MNDRPDGPTAAQARTTDPIREKLERLPEGWFEASFKGRRYGVTKSAFAGGRSLKLVGRELGGADDVSLNSYRLRNGDHLLRACEAPVEKVAAFVAGLEVAG